MLDNYHGSYSVTMMDHVTNETDPFLAPSKILYLTQRTHLLTCLFFKTIIIYINQKIFKDAMVLYSTLL